MGKKRAVLLLPMLLMFLVMAGCFFKSGDELYSLPKAPEDYLMLQAQLDAVIRGGAEYAAPQAGTNTQTVQMVDLNGDGKGEAVAFFRDTTSQKPLKIYIFQQEKEGYEVVAIIEGDGVAVNSIVYAELTGDEWSEIVVSWQMSAKVQSMTVYTLKNFAVSQMMQTGYANFTVCDLDQDNREEIVVFHTDAGEMGSRADYYDYDGKDLVQTGSESMSSGISEITGVKAGKLANFIPALYVECAYTGGETLTDIFACRNGKFVNLTRDPNAEVSTGTVRYYSIFCTDINLDGILEVPKPVPLPVFKSTGSSNYWMIHWMQYSLDGTAARVLSTYHNYADAWYLELPGKWIDHITVSRMDSVSGERTVVFSRWIDMKTEPVPFLTICKLTGANREERSRLGNRFVLLRDATGSDAIYTGEFINQDTTGDFNIGRDALMRQFHLIYTDWNAE